MSGARAAVVTVYWPKGEAFPWRIRIDGRGALIKIQRTGVAPRTEGRGNATAIATDIDGICLALTKMVAAGEPLPQTCGAGLYGTIVAAVRDAVRKRRVVAARLVP